MQARRRHEPAEWERRLENLEVVTALGERDATRPNNRRRPESRTGQGELGGVIARLIDGIGVGVDASLSGRPWIEVHRLAWRSPLRPTVGNARDDVVTACSTLSTRSSVRAPRSSSCAGHRVTAYRQRARDVANGTEPEEGCTSKWNVGEVAGLRLIGITEAVGFLVDRSGFLGHRSGWPRRR